MGASKPDSIEAAFSSWRALNDRLLDCICALPTADLELSAGAGRWPIWAIAGHAACQRVFWLCDFAGEPGAAATPFIEATWNCPGDDDLTNALDAPALRTALTSTFAIVSRALATWTLADLTQEISQPKWGDDWVHTRGAVIQRVFAHDVWHAAEVNEVLTMHGRTGLDLWN